MLAQSFPHDGTVQET